ncbi:MAG TPA: alpha/beta hydrolase [Micromonosporaceae bacterium]|jgi:pimeloyl-ACP methyl ester carboxylesterase
MTTVTSADGTTIAYEIGGSGPTVILVDGAMCHRAGGPLRPLAARLTGSFTVVTYDRRGRNESTDTLPYAVEREIEDLAALIDAVGGPVHLYGISSGGALVLRATAAGLPVSRIAVYEIPFVAADNEAMASGSYRRRLDEALAAGRRGDAVALFLEQVGMPAPMIENMRSGPGWPAMEAIAPTLAYDDSILGDARVPTGVTSQISIPALVADGGASPQMLRTAAKSVAEALPDARHVTLDGQTHDVDPDVIAPVLVDFFGA